MRSTFEYGIKASGDKMEIHGHNWEIIEIRKIDEIKLLVWVIDSVLCIYIWIIESIRLQRLEPPIAVKAFIR